MTPQTNKLPESSSTSSHRFRGAFSINFIVKAALILFIAYPAGYYDVVRLNLPSPWWVPSRHKHAICRPPLPPLKYLALDLNDQQIRRASRKLNASLRELASLDDVDSITVAVVTPDGPVFSKGYGVRRANETGTHRGQVDEDTIYRIASVSKMFTVLELWILREKGALKWDDDITKYLPQFRYFPGGWAEHQKLNSLQDYPRRPSDPITLRQVASHMSGIPRDFPPALLWDWPNSMKGSGLPHYTRRPTPSESEIFEAIQSFPLTNNPYSPPLYSNTGFALLGMVALAAHRAQGGQAKTFPDLIQQDIFDRLGLNGSSFLVTNESSGRVAIASYDSDEIDMNLGIMNAAYGQMSSVADLTKLMQTFLDSSHPESLISPYSLREWLRPTHAWMDDMTEVGLSWEILKITDSYDRRQRVYQKMGEFMGHNSGFAFNPTSSFGVTVLMTGAYGDTEKVITNAFKYFQPAFDALHERATKKLYSGTWKSEESNSTAVISVADGSLWMDKFTLQGSDILAVLRDDYPEKVALASTGRDEEFRLAKGYRPYTGKAHYGCMPFWVINDPGHSPRGAPVDIIYFVDHEDGTRTLEVPSSGISLKRVLPHSCGF